MKRISIGKRFEAGAIALGVMRMAGLSDADAEAAVMTAVDCGIDLIDNADIYGGGESECALARVFRRNPGLRERIVLQDKVGICEGYYDASCEHIVTAAEGCLSRLEVDSLDTLLLHRPDALMQPEEVAEAFTRLRDQGKARYFGVSNANPAQIELLNRYMPGEIIINQLQFSLCHSILVDEGLNVNLNSAHAQVLDGNALDYCRLRDITIQAWSPFQFGFFGGVFLGSDQYPALNREIDTLAEQYRVTNSAIAAAWILRHPANIQVIAGSMNPRRIRDIAAASEVTLTRPEWYRLYLAAGNPLP